MKIYINVDDKSELDKVSCENVERCNSDDKSLYAVVYTEYDMYNVCESCDDKIESEETELSNLVQEIVDLIMYIKNGSRQDIAVNLTADEYIKANKLEDVDKDEISKAIKIAQEITYHINYLE